MSNDSNSQRPRLADLLKIAESLPRRRDPENLFVHPDVLAAIKDAAAFAGPMGILGRNVKLFGMPVYSSSLMPKHPRKWQFPRDPFVDYEKSDEAWARPVNYGKEVDDTTKLIGYSIRMPRY